MKNDQLYQTTNQYDNHRNKLINAIILPPEELELAYQDSTTLNYAEIEAIDTA